MNAVGFEAIRATYLPEVEKQLASFLDRQEEGGLKWNAAMARYHLGTGGKRLRALIPSWLFARYGKDPRAIIPLGCAIELVHNATLVHDDLQDRDITRRGFPTVWKRFSEAQAINCGDAFFQFATRMLGELSVSEAVWKRISLRVAQGVLHVIEGQSQEFLMKEESFPGWDRYLGVISGKTASLFATSVGATLMALDRSSDEIARAESAALETGILFQLQDDLLDLYGDKQRDRRGSDIAEGKVSALVAAFNELAPPEEKRRVAEVLGMPRETVSEADIAEVMGCFRACGADSTVLARMECHRQRSRELRGAGSSLDGWFAELEELFLRPISGIVAGAY